MTDRKTTPLWIQVAVLGGLFAFAGIANAGSISFSFDVELTGSGGTLSSPVIVTLDDQDSAGSVLITIDLSALSADEFMTGLYLNFNPGKDASALLLTDDALTDAPSDGFTAGADCCDPPPGPIGALDLLIEFDTSNAGGGATRLNGGEVYVGTFSGLADLIAADFGFLNATGNCGIARMQGLGDNAEDSGWFDCGDDHQEVDEPSSLALLGLGLGLLVLTGRRRVVRCG